MGIGGAGDCCQKNLSDLRQIQSHHLVHSVQSTEILCHHIHRFKQDVAVAQMDFSTMSMGQIHQFTLEVVDKLCRQHQHQYFSYIMNRKAKYSRASKKPYLEIKCREKDLPLFTKDKESPTS